MSDASGWITASVVTVCLLLVAIGLVYLHPRARLRRYEREAARFQRDPRVGDVCGFEVRNNAWLVGEVIRVHRVGGELHVHFTYPDVGPFGQRDTGIDSPVALVEWFPPSTPLGRHLGKPEVL